MSHAVLKAVAHRTFASLPPDVRKTLNAVKVRMAPLGRDDYGRRTLGCTAYDGNQIVLDTRTVERYAGAGEEFLEDVLGHEFAHAYRARRKLADMDDEVGEEIEADNLARQWGFNSKKGSR